MKGKILFIAILAMIAPIVFYGAGCNPFQNAQEKVSKKVAEKMLESISGGDVDVDLKDDGVSISLKDEQGGGEMFFGENVKIPNDLKDVIISYPGAVPKSVIRDMNGSKGAFVSLKTSDKVEKIIAWYEKEYTDKNWVKTQTISMNNTEMRAFEKDGDQLLVTVGPDEEDKDSAIAISWSAKE